MKKKAPPARPIKVRKTKLDPKMGLRVRRGYLTTEIDGRNVSTELRVSPPDFNVESGNVQVPMRIMLSYAPELAHPKYEDRLVAEILKHLGVLMENLK